MNLTKSITRRRLAIALGIVAVLAALVVVLTALSTPRSIPNAATVRRGDLSASITATGKVRAKRSAKLSLPQSGIVASVSKMEGDTVNAGDVIL
ncbi:MAG: biotin/lipoyl-binding protein, partial [Acidobacteriota bacterium]